MPPPARREGRSRDRTGNHKEEQEWANQRQASSDQQFGARFLNLALCPCCVCSSGGRAGRNRARVRVSVGWFFCGRKNEFGSFSGKSSAIWLKESQRQRTSWSVRDFYFVCYCIAVLFLCPTHLPSLLRLATPGGAGLRASGFEQNKFHPSRLSANRSSSRGASQI